MATRTLITGMAGFAGSHLAEALLQEGDHVEGLCLKGESLANIEALSKKVSLHWGDTRSASSLAQTIRKAKPEVIYHLAAMTSIPGSEHDPKRTLDTNFVGTLNLIQAMQKEAPKARLVHISSSEVYGKVPVRKNPVKESQPLAPIHFYGFTKLIAEKFLRYCFRTKGLSVILLRPFNHVGPRQSDAFVCSSFAKQIAAIEQGKQSPVIRVGNLSPVRDFTDVRDMVRAYRLASGQCKEGIPYNVASGKGVSIQEVLLEILSFSTTEIEVLKDPSRFRVAEIPVLTGDASLFAKTTGWRRQIPLSQTLKDLFLYWKQRWTEGP